MEVVVVMKYHKDYQQIVDMFHSLTAHDVQLQELLIRDDASVLEDLSLLVYGKIAMEYTMQVAAGQVVEQELIAVVLVKAVIVLPQQEIHIGETGIIQAKEDAMGNRRRNNESTI